MTTMNLRTGGSGAGGRRRDNRRHLHWGPSKGSSALGAKHLGPEVVPGVSNDDDDGSLLTSHLRKCDTLEGQIKFVRQVCSNDGDAKLDPEVADLYFRLRPQSSLKAAIASAVNKATSGTGSDGDENRRFRRHFEGHLDLLLEAGCLPDLVQGICRCLEHDCLVGLAAVLALRPRLAEALEQGLQRGKGFDASDPDLIRTVVTLQGLDDRSGLQRRGRTAMTPTFLETLRWMCCSTAEHMFSGDEQARFNLFLALVLEYMAVQPRHDGGVGPPAEDDYFARVFEDFALRLSDIKDSVRVCHALAVSAEISRLFPTAEGSPGPPADFWDVFRHLHSLPASSDLAFMAVHSVAVLHLIRRLRSFLDGSSAAAAHHDDSVDLSDEHLEALELTQSYCWIWIDQPVNKVVHNGKDILTELARLLSRQGDGAPWMRGLVNSALRLPWEAKAKYRGLLAVVQGGAGPAVRMLLQEVPDMASRLLEVMEKEPILLSSVQTLYTSLMAIDHQAGRPSRSDPSAWFDRWFSPIKLRLLDPATTTTTCPSREEATMTVEAVEPLIRAGITLHRDLFLSGSSNPAATAAGFKWVLIVFKKLRQQESDSGGFQLHGCGLFPEAALFHRSDEVRVLAMEAMVCSKSSRAFFRPEELDQIRRSLPGLMVLEDASHRQALLASFRKMFNRIQESVQPSRRSRHDVEVEVDLTAVHLQFVVDVGQFLFDSLFEGAHLSRRVVAVEGLQMLLSRFSSEASTATGLILSRLFGKDQYLTLAKCLEDPYEHVKEAALDCLSRFPEEVRQDGPPSEAHLAERFRTLLRESCKPPDCVTAKFIMQFLLVRQRGDYDGPWFLDALMGILAAQLAVAKESLVRASQEGPMYGAIYCIRGLLDDITTTSWLVPSKVRNLVDMCFEAASVVADVVDDDSPEGHLPDGCDGHHRVGAAGDNRDVLAQKVLLCSWRTVKEVSLLLGQLFGPQQGSHRLLRLGDDDFRRDEIFEFFVSRLSSVKHRGAFEQVYQGFCSVCSSVWSTDGPDSEYLVQMLADALASLKPGHRRNAALCSSRRSAGIPFLIQAIVTTRPTLDPLWLRNNAMHPLMVGLNNNGQSAESTTVHAFNVLRVLFKDALLGEAVAEFVEDGVRLAIAGINSSNSWALRNSATLLLSSLMTRMFGVKRSKEDLSKRNAVSWKSFFQRYPSLRQLLLDQVEAAAVKVVASKVECSRWGSTIGAESAVMPTLMILAKLSPGHDGLSLTGFDEGLTTILGSSVCSIRKLAASALVTLNGPVVLDRPRSTGHILEKVASILDRIRFSDHNLLHGSTLLMANYAKLLPAAKQVDSSIEDPDLIQVRNKIVEGLLALSLADGCSFTKAATLDVLLTLCLKLPDFREHPSLPRYFPRDAASACAGPYGPYCMEDRPREPGVDHLVQVLTKLGFLVDPKPWQVLESVRRQIRSSKPDTAALEALLEGIYKKSHYKLTFDLDLDSDGSAIVVGALLKEIEEVPRLSSLCTWPDSIVKKYLKAMTVVLSTEGLQLAPDSALGALDGLLELFQDPFVSEAVQGAVLVLSGRLVRHAAEGLNRKIEDAAIMESLGKWLGFVRTSSWRTQPDKVRLGASSALGDNAEFLAGLLFRQGRGPPSSGVVRRLNTPMEIRLDFWKSVLNMALDDDRTVRDTAHDMVMAEASRSLPEHLRFDQLAPAFLLDVLLDLIAQDFVDAAGAMASGGLGPMEPSLSEWFEAICFPEADEGDFRQEVEDCHAMTVESAFDKSELCIFREDWMLRKAVADTVIRHGDRSP